VALVAFAVVALVWFILRFWPIVLVGGVLIVAARIAQRRARQRQWRADISTLHGLLSLTPIGFEHAVAMFLREEGWHDVKMVGGPGDLGADLLAVDPQGRLVVVQVKQYAAGSVGSPVVQALIGSMTIHGGDRGLLVTTGYFTRPAIDLAHSHHVDLVDQGKLVTWAQRTQSAAPRSWSPPPPPGSVATTPQPPAPSPKAIATSPPLHSLRRPASERQPSNSGRWDQYHWRVCIRCRAKTRWRNEQGQAVCPRCRTNDPESDASLT
jgi:restriction system protein